MNRRVLVIPTLAAAILTASCRHPTTTATASPADTESHCWWSVARTLLPPDSVAEHFTRAHEAVGFTNAAWRKLADTAWASAGPTALERGVPGARYSARAVAYRRGDSTHFRWYLGIAPPRDGWSRSADTLRLSGRFIALCGEISRIAAVHGLAPREPTGEESLGVWKKPK